MKLQGLSMDVLNKAVSVYWEKAYAQAKGAHTKPRFSLQGGAKPQEVLALFQKEVMELLPSHACVRYTMRLGNRNYPFMKLLLQEHILAGEYFFAVDTHDEMEIKPNFPDYQAWMVVRRFNRKLKQEIESSFAENGLDTAAALRALVARRGPQEGISRGRSILVVDDEEDLAETVESLLRARGYRMSKVHDGKAAVRAALDLLPDLILLDYELPEMDGLEVIEVLRSDEKTRKIPVLLTTASRVTIDEIKMADGFLAKPFQEALLYELVERTLAKAKGVR